MRLLIAPDYDELSQRGAGLIADLIAKNPTATIVVATGNTPMGAYRELAQRRQRDRLETRKLRIFQLDDYAGIAPDDPRTLYGWMKREFLDPLEIPDEQVVRLRGDAPDLAAECAAFDRRIESAGGFDLAILGLGSNGHLGFNEPRTEPDAPAHVVDLTPETIERNADYWGSVDRVPRRAVTAGLKSLMAAREIVLLVAGGEKSRILQRALKGPITPNVPASYLQRVTNVTVIADQAAAQGLRR